MPFLAFAQKNTFIKGKISNLKDGKCYLSATINSKKIVLDSAILKSDGSFSMSFNINEQTKASFKAGDEVATILLDAGDDLLLYSNYKLFDETLTFYGKGAEKNNAIKNIVLTTEMISEKVSSFDKDADTMIVYTYMEKTYANFKEVIADYVKEIPELKNYAETEYKNIDESIQQTKDFNAFIKKMASLKGTTALDFEGIDLKGNRIKASSFKGKITVIDFWATWCGPCKAEMPSLKTLEEKYGSEINFVSVALYCKQEAWQTMATDLGFKNNIYLSKNDQSQIEAYSVGFIPRYIVIDENYKIIDAMAPRPSSGELQKYFSQKK